MYLQNLNIKKLAKGDYQIIVLDFKNNKGTPADFAIQTYAEKQLLCMKESLYGACKKGHVTSRNVKLYNKPEGPTKRPVAIKLKTE